MEFSDGGFHFRLLKHELSSTIGNKDDSHIGICSRRVGRTDTGIDKPIVVVLKSWNVHIKDLLDMVRKTNFFDFDARNCI